MKKLLLAVVFGCGLSVSAHADDSWTEIGLYGFASSITGDAQIRNVTTDVDVPFSDILENLDLGGMVFLEHRRGPWSLVGDLIFMTISDDATVASNTVLSVTLDAEFTQILAGGLVGYRVIEQDHNGAKFGIDLLGGARYNVVDVDIGVQANLLGLTTSASRSRSEKWADGVIGVRAQYGNPTGWSISALADYGKGADSSSYQLFGVVNYRFENNVRIFGGYRHFNLTYEDGSGTSRIELDLDYSGPAFGVSYRF